MGPARRAFSDDAPPPVTASVGTLLVQRGRVLLWARALGHCLDIAAAPAGLGPALLPWGLFWAPSPGGPRARGWSPGVSAGGAETAMPVPPCSVPCASRACPLGWPCLSPALSPVPAVPLPWDGCACPPPCVPPLRWPCLSPVPAVPVPSAGCACPPCQLCLSPALSPAPAVPVPRPVPSRPPPRPCPVPGPQSLALALAVPVSRPVPPRPAPGCARGRVAGPVPRRSQPRCPSLEIE